MTTQSPIRTAILGLGRMGWSGHFERLAKDPRYQIAAVADQVEANRGRAVEKCGCAAFADAADVLARLDNLDVELVVNVLPSHLHVDPGMAVLAAGRHVVIDKPVAPDAPGALRLIEQAARSGKRLFAHHNRRFAKQTRYLRSLLDRGVLGRVFQMNVNMALPFSRRNDWQTLRSQHGGLLRNHGTHWLDLAMHLLGAPAADIWGDTRLIAAAGDAEDHFRVTFRAPGGCVVDLLGSTACAAALPLVLLCGTRGTFASDYVSSATLRVFDPAALPPLDVDLGAHENYQGPAIPLQETRVDLKALPATGDFYDNVYDVLRNGAEPGVPLDQVVEIHRVIDVVLARKMSDWREPQLRARTSAASPAAASLASTRGAASVPERPEQFDLTSEWIAKIRALAPARPSATPLHARRALMVSICRGFQHWVAPHTAAVVRAVAEMTGALRVTETTDMLDFLPGRLAAFDAVILNNTCPVHPRRAFFADYVGDEALAEALKESVLDFVARGGGLVALHGGGLAYMNCPKWEAMQGATFDYHPAQQLVTLTAVERAHPLAQAFGDEPFVHYDEPYLFANKYTPQSYRPLMVMDTRNMIWRKDKPVPTEACHVAWIKRYNHGRFFYCSPSHNAQSFEDPRLLRFILDGIQYALGDLKCDDSPLPIAAGRNPRA